MQRILLPLKRRHRPKQKKQIEKKRAREEKKLMKATQHKNMRFCHTYSTDCFSHDCNISSDAYASDSASFEHGGGSRSNTKGEYVVLVCQKHNLRRS